MKLKPCSKNRKLIAWLVLDALEAPRAAALRDHLRQCEGCRRYCEELSNVTEELAAATRDSEVETSERFHQRVANQLAQAPARSVWDAMAALLRAPAPGWRLVLPAVAALVIAVVVIFAARHPAPISRPEAPTPQAASPTSPGGGLPPTIAYYQMIASQSLDKLDEVLTRTGNQRLPPAPLYTASSLGLADSSP